MGEVGSGAPHGLPHESRVQVRAPVHVERVGERRLREHIARGEGRDGPVFREEEAQTLELRTGIQGPLVERDREDARRSAVVSCFASPSREPITPHIEFSSSILKRTSKQCFWRERFKPRVLKRLAPAK